MKRWILGCLACITALTFSIIACAEDLPRGYIKGQGYQYFEIGTYPQGKSGEITPVIWRALTIENHQALLLTEYVLDAKQVIFEQDETIIAKHAYRRIKSFADSDLCQWMNTSMLQTIMGNTGLENALVAGEFGKLYPLTDRQLLTAEYGFSTARFGSVPVRRATATAYAKNEGAYCDTNGSTPYWVATVKTAEGYKLQIVGYNGHLSYGAYTRTNIGIRAAMTLNLDQCVLSGGKGTLEEPYRVALAAGIATTAPTETRAEAPSAAPATIPVTSQATPSPEALAATEAKDGVALPTEPAVTAAEANGNPEESAMINPNAPTVSDGSATINPSEQAASLGATVAAVSPTPALVTAQKEADTVKISLIGDCSIGDGYRSRNASGSLTRVIADNGAAWPFSLLAHYMTEDDLNRSQPRSMPDRQR